MSSVEKGIGLVYTADMVDAVLVFITAHPRIFLTLHLLGVAAGMGGATIADILFFNFLRDFTISKKEAEVLHLLSHLILGALGLLYLSGIALFLSDPQTYLGSAAFLAKATIVVVLTINGIVMHNIIAPRMVGVSFVRDSVHIHVMHKLRPIAFALGAVSFTSWYTVFFIAMLKSYLPPEIRLVHILSAYFLIICAAVTMSQFLHRHLHRRSAPKNSTLLH